MGAVTAVAGWAAEDDVLLKHAVEAGASLESLVKGAVSFSRQFTLQELQDRWYSLLYDSETSAQASARMAKYEMELATSNPAKANKIFNSKAKCFSLCKRKIDSVKNQYYAMRKRVFHEPCLSANFDYVIAPRSSSHFDDGSVCGGHLLVHKVDSSRTAVSGFGSIGGSCDERRCLSHTEHANSDGRVIDGNVYHASPHGYSDVDQLCGYDDMQKSFQASERNLMTMDNINRSDLNYQFHNEATGSKARSGSDHNGLEHGQYSGSSTVRSLEPGLFKAISQKWCYQAPSTCTKVQGINSPDMLTDIHRIEAETLTLSDDKKMETNNSDALALQANFDGVISGSGLSNAMVSECGFMHPYLKGFSQKGELELLSSKYFSDSALDANQEDLGDAHTEVFLMPPTDVTSCDNHIDAVQKKQNLADASGIDSIDAASEVFYPEHNVDCMLNTEDLEIPFNAHTLIPGQSYLEPTSTFNKDSQHDTCLIPMKLINMENSQPSPSAAAAAAAAPPPPSPENLESAFLEQKETMVSHNEGSTEGSEQPGMHGEFGANNTNMCGSALHSVDEGEETTCGFVQHELQNMTLDKSIQVPNRMNCKFLADVPKIGFETATGSCAPSDALPDMEFHNPIAIISTSGQSERSDCENSVPNYFDLEALILDQDLIPWDQESDFIQPEVSRFQYPEIRKDLIRLEKGACSYMNRSIMSKGAFAILYGKHLKYYIRYPEVTIGRETGDVHVDIDLGKEGKANKISRRQAVIKMDDSGSFYLKNIGKYSVFVNSKEVPCNKLINLISDSLLEIRNMKFIFHVNHAAVKQYIVRTRRESSQGENTAFDWNQNP